MLATRREQAIEDEADLLLCLSFSLAMQADEINPDEAIDRVNCQLLKHVRGFQVVYACMQKSRPVLEEEVALREAQEDCHKWIHGLFTNT